MRHSVLTLFVVCCVAGADAVAGSRQGLVVHFFDVGQGDAALILVPGGKSVLVDAGPPEAGPQLARRVKELVHGPLDLVVLTHAHLDHAGGMLDVLQAVGARRYLDSGFVEPSQTYERLLTFIQEKVPEVVSPEPDHAHPDHLLTIGLGPGTSLTILWPRRPFRPFLQETHSDANANSIVARLTYGKTAFLFAGDAEAETEERLLETPQTLRADLLKVAHHGSRYASSPRFLAAVRPHFAVVSVGAGNEYNHPAEQTLARLHDLKARVLRTDIEGEIQVSSDGRRLRVQIDKRRREPLFAASRSSPVFHRRSCPAIRAIAKGDLVTYGTRQDALAHRQPAEDCRP